MNAQLRERQVAELVKLADDVWHHRIVVEDAHTVVDAILDMRPTEAFAAPKEAGADEAFVQVCNALGIGSAARTVSCALTNIRNLQTFSRHLDAIEREFFMVPGEPDDDFPDDKPEPECLLNKWGSTTKQYVEQFRAALPRLAAPSKEAGASSGLRDLLDWWWQRLPNLDRRAAVHVEELLRGIGQELRTANPPGDQRQEGVINYFWACDVAAKFNIDYNQFSAALRTYLKGPGDVASPPPEAAARAQVSNTTAILIGLLESRDATGLAKYGQTLDRTDLTPEQWLQHMTEELLDGAGYAQSLLREIAGLRQRASAE